MIECPECGEETTQEALDQWEMCHDCDNQMCTECGTIDCGCDEHGEYYCPENKENK